MSHHHSRPRRSADEWICHVFDSRHPLLARVVGIPYRAELEVAVSPDRVDHVWLTLQVPPCGTVLLSINTLSRLNLLNGYDPRVRVGIFRTTWTEKPEPLMEEFAGLDYTTIEAQSPIPFTLYEHQALAELLLARNHAAIRVEAWGELYRRDHLGMHQIHSRRASCAVSTDVVGRDGALRFYLPDGQAEMFLFKYCGQP